MRKSVRKASEGERLAMLLWLYVNHLPHLQDAAAQYKQNTGKDVSVTLDSVNSLPAKDDPHDP